MAYNDPVRLELKGDRVAAARYVRLGRALLWKLARLTFPSGATQARRIVKLSNGVVIGLELMGAQASIVIEAPTGAGGTLKLDDVFVVYPRDASRPTGVTAEYPEMILAPADEEQQWITYFYDPDVPGYEAFARPKGTYRTDKGEIAFPDGIQHAGNIDWLSPEGFRVSWYGPSTRHWCDPWVQPRSQYGKHVFMLGQVLLDVEAYIAECEEQPAFAEQWILGAALKDDWLYIIHADLPVGTTTTGTAPPATIFVEGPFPQTANVPVVLSRIRIADDVSEQQAMRLKPVADTREVLWSGTLARAFQPWFFNQSVSTAHSIAPPAQVHAVTQNFNLVQGPSATQPLYRLNIGADSAALQTTTLGLPAAPSTAEAVVAADYVENQLREYTTFRRETGVNPGAWYIRADGQEHLLYAETTVGPNVNFFRIVMRRVLFADPRAATIVFARADVTSNGSGGIAASDCDIEIWRGGVLVKEIAVPTLDMLGSGLGQQLGVSSEWRNRLDDQPVAPMFPIYSIFMGVRASSIVNFIYFTGAHGLFGNMAYPQTEMFGSRALVGPFSSGSYNPFQSEATFGSNIADLHGKYSVLGCATFEDRTVYSGYGYNTPAALHFADLVPLPELTGVTGVNERYHPVWLLGALPRQATA